MLSRKIHHLCHFCFRDFVRKYPAFSDAVVVNMKHDASRFFAVFLEEVLHNVNDKLHRRVVVIQQQHTIQIWPLGNRFRPGDNDRSGIATVIVIIRACRHCPVYRLIHSGHHSFHTSGQKLTLESLPVTQTAAPKNVRGRFASTVILPRKPSLRNGRFHQQTGELHKSA